MGVFDFVKDAGAAVGVGKSTKETKAEEARKKADAAVAAAKKEEAEKKRASAAAAKAKAASAAKVKKARDNAAMAAKKEAEMEHEKAQQLTKYVTDLGLKARGLEVGFNDGVATVKGVAANAATKEKIVLALGNVEGVRQVRESLKVAPARKAAAGSVTPAQRKAATARRKAASSAQAMHTVKSGDTLSKIAKKYLGDANRYPEIFKANQPMLTDPDKIQIGQVLRIPRK